MLQEHCVHGNCTEIWILQLEMKSQLPNLSHENRRLPLAQLKHSIFLFHVMLAGSLETNVTANYYQTFNRLIVIYSWLNCQNFEHNSMVLALKELKKRYWQWFSLKRAWPILMLALHLWQYATFNFLPVLHYFCCTIHFKITYIFILILASYLKLLNVLYLYPCNSHTQLYPPLTYLINVVYVTYTNRLIVPEASK